MTDAGCRRMMGREFRESDKNLRELEAAIRNAYVTKELEAQVREAEASRLAAQVEDRLRTARLKIESEKAEKIVEEAALKKRTEKLSYGLELQEAIACKEKEREIVRKVESKERKILEEVSQFIEEKERLKIIAEKYNLAERKSRELQIFREIKEIRRQEEMEILEDERRENFEYLRMFEERIAAIKKSRIEQETAREAVIEMVAKSLLEAEEKKLKIEAMLEDLAMEEKWFEEKIKLREEEERRKIAKEETEAEMKRHLRVIEERKLRHAIEEEEFAAAVMRRVLDDARVERLTAEAKKRKQIQYRQALEFVMEERRARRVEEILRLKESLRLERERNTELKKRVKEMREKLLVKHAGNVAEFIATGILTVEERAILDDIITAKKSQC